jgi:RTX calcium-binding nonapeptide repeat (4 copies)
MLRVVAVTTGLAALAIGLLHVSLAHAATVRVEVHSVPSFDKNPAPRIERHVLYAAAPEEENRLRIRVDAAGAHFSDAAQIEPGSGCERPTGASTTEAVCRGGVTYLVADLGDRNDAGVSEHVIRLTGGPGNDELSASGTLDGGPGDDRLASAGHATMIGGPGADHFLGGRSLDAASYSGHTEPVNADLDGVADDGSAGENDYISGEVENLYGGSGDDVLTGNTGDNLLSGGDGADIVDAGAGHDSVDGGSGSNVVSGGPGWDDVRSSDWSRSKGSRLSGGSGNDQINGSEGPDELDGGLGQDEMMGGGGDDRLIAGDGRRDDLVCDRGRSPRPGDVAVADEQEWAENCGTIERVGTPRLVHLRGALGPGRRTFFVHLGCPVDAKRRCVGSVRLLAGRRSAGVARFRIKRGADRFVDYRFTRATRRVVRRFPEERLRVRFRTRDARGRLRVLRGPLSPGFFRGTLGARDLASLGRPVPGSD